MKVSPKEIEQNCFFSKTTFAFLTTLRRSSASALERGEALKCVMAGPPPVKFAGHLCSFPQWRCVCDSVGTLLESPLCVCAERASPRWDIWARSSSHSQLYLIWNLAGVGRAVRPSVYLCCLTPHLSVFSGTSGECSFSQLSYFLVRLFSLSFLTFPCFPPALGRAFVSDTPHSALWHHTHRLCISPEGDSVELLLHWRAQPPHGLQICAPSRVARSILQIHKWQKTLRHHGPRRGAARPL